MAKKPTLNYYVTLHGETKQQTKKRYFAVNKDFVTRDQFSLVHGSKMTIEGHIFRPSDVHAEPTKKHGFLEVFICLMATFSLLYYVPGQNFHLSPARWAIGMFLALILGILIGRSRIGLQQADADYFNKS